MTEILGLAPRPTLGGAFSGLLFRFSAVTAAGIAIACAPRAIPDDPPPAGPLVLCVDPRPELCSREYLPVCGTRVDGSDWTYANRCSACGHATVVGHRPGECKFVASYTMTFTGEGLVPQGRINLISSTCRSGLMPARNHDAD
jgi:hypothetical protein